MTADFILLKMSDGLSVIKILESGFGADFDIFSVGDVSDKIRFDGAEDMKAIEVHQKRYLLFRVTQDFISSYHSQIRGRGIGKVSPNCLLNDIATSLANSKCCC